MKHDEMTTPLLIVNIQELGPALMLCEVGPQFFLLEGGNNHNCFLWLGMVVLTFNSAPRRQRQADTCKFEASLVYERSPGQPLLFLIS